VNGQAAGYTYTNIAALEKTVPGGVQYYFDFETGQINNRGDVIYVLDLNKNGDPIGEGVFLLSHGQIVALSLPGNPAPGGGTFSVSRSRSSNRTCGSPASRLSDEGIN
jgi:hypothetical protein